MKICVYCEPLRVKTSGTPMRNMIKELLTLRSGDQFLLVVRKGYEKDSILMSFFESIGGLTNWEIKVEPVSRKISNILGLLRYPSYCKLSTKADLYLNPDCNYLGKKAHPLIITVMDLSSFRSLEQTSYKRNWQLRLRRFMIENGIMNADRIITISDYTKGELTEKFPGIKNNTATIYNGIDPQWMQTSGTTVAHYTDYWIWWGMITGRKNIPNLIKAYGILKKEVGDLPKLMIVYGNDVLPEEITVLIDQHNLHEDIILERSKPLNELISLVSNSKGLVFPSFVEGFGMPVIESYARGVPVLTSDTTSLREIGGGLNVMVDPHDIQSIGNGLKELAIASFSEEAISRRKERASNFTPGHAAREYSRIIDSFTS